MYFFHLNASVILQERAICARLICTDSPAPGMPSWNTELCHN